MLVLSREAGDGISFPELDMAVKVLKVQGARVQLGFSGPTEIRVLREELVSRGEAQLEQSSAEAKHALRNRLNVATLALAICERHLERGDLRSAELALKRVSSVSKDTPTTSTSENAKQIRNNKVSAKSMRVLLIEDNANEASLLAAILELHGVTVEMVRNGRDAIASLQHDLPDAILMDMNLPGWDGPTILQEIRKDTRLQNLPVYAVSGASQVDLGIKIDESEGVNDWFQKPVKPSELLDRLQRTPSPTVAC
jgi:carbon storage regulator CsrA